MRHNLYSAFARRFADYATKPALRSGDGQIYTFADLERESGRYAALLAALGLERGDRVCVQVEKSAPAVFLYLGCLRAGVIYVPLNPAYQRNEIEHFLADAEPRLMVCRPQNREWIAPLASAAHVEHLFELADDGTGELAKRAESSAPTQGVAAVEPDDIAAILYTSGTTGRSKGAMLSHRNLLANTEVLHRSWEWRSEDVLLHVLPIFHVHGLFVALHGALYSGSTMLFETKFDPARTIAQLKDATVFMGVPTHYTRLLSENSLDKSACANVRLFVSGSAPLLPATFDEFRERTGHTILERYGMTETNMLASNPYRGARVAGTVGPPLPGVEIRIVDDRDAPVDPEVIGHVQVRGPNVFKGYWRRADKNREEFTADGYFRTGDLGQFSATGYLSIVGRHKDLIITGGLNVYPKEIEEALDALAGVRESAVIGVPDADFGEAVTAVVIRSDPHITAESLLAELKTRLANFKVPKRVYFVDELPRNAMGKVQKKELRARFAVRNAEGRN
jgi:malonyl-CoA/methylmalonyl-CoA synthetase